MNNEKKGKTKSIVLIVIVVFIAVILVLFDKYDKEKERGVSLDNQINEVDNTQDYKLRESEYKIDVQERNDDKVIKNIHAGISLIIPKEWDPGFVYDKKEELKLKVSKAGPNQPSGPTDLIDGAMLEIYEYNNQTSLSLNEWMRDRKMEDCSYTSFQQFYAAKREGPMLKESDDSFDLIPRKNSYFFSYYISFNDKIIELSCSSFGADYVKYIQECENILIKSLSIK